MALSFKEKRNKKKSKKQDTGSAKSGERVAAFLNQENGRQGSPHVLADPKAVHE